MGAALDYATGDAVVLMDADLQDQPEVIPEFVRHYEAGADVVFARRTTREEGWIIRMLYKVFYRLIAALSDTKLPLDSGDFALLGTPVTAALRKLPERERYLRGLRAWVGFTQTAVTFERESRAAGKTKYSLGRMLRFSFDAITSFSHRPLQFATLLGFAFSALGFVVVIGTSRKSFLGRLTGRTDPHDRVAATVATSVLAFERGARVFRVHDVAPTADALKVAAATLPGHGA